MIIEPYFLTVITVKFRAYMYESIYILWYLFLNGMQHENDTIVHHNATHCITRSLNEQLHTKQKATSVTAYVSSMMWRIHMIRFVVNSTMCFLSSIHHPSFWSIDTSKIWLHFYSIYFPILKLQENIYLHYNISFHWS